MEASALQAPAGLARARISVSAPLLRLRSDDQLLALFRAGNDDAFGAIHDRYRQRLFAYTKQMLPGSSQDAEDALQDVFIRAYAGLRANRRELALRPWLYRVAHNRCIDELRRPVPPPPEALHRAAVAPLDPAAHIEQRESLQRLIIDLRRLPDQQRSALLMRELGGMTYVDIAGALDVSVPAVKSLLVRARIGLALAAEARNTACVEIREDLTLAHDRGVRPSGTVRRHLADCGPCREFRSEVRGSRREFAALLPAIGPIGMLANVLGIGGGGAGAAATSGGAATTGAVVGGGTATTGAVVGGGTAATAGTFAAGATHVATLIAAAVVTAGGAVALQNTVAPTPHRGARPDRPAIVRHSSPSAATPAPYSVAEPAALPDTRSVPAMVTDRPEIKRPGPGTSGDRTTRVAPTPVSGGDNIVPTGGASTDPTGGIGQTATRTSSPTDTSPSAGTGTSQCSSSTSTVVCTPASTGSNNSTGSASTTGSGASGSGTGTGSGTGSATPSGVAPATTGPTATAAGATTTTPTGTSTGP